MSKRLVLLAASAAAAAVFAGSSAAAPADPFVGAWVGVESPVGDGSTDYMVLGAPGAHGVRSYHAWETWATFCGGGPLASSGTAVSAGNVLTVTIAFAACANGSPGAFPLPVVVTMTATGDGHIDAGGVIFSRIGSHGIDRGPIRRHSLVPMISWGQRRLSTDHAEARSNGVQLLA
jgi:hypothetical protein